MGTTRIKLIDLSSSEKEVKTSRKRAGKIAGSAKVKEEKPATTQVTEENLEKAQIVPSEHPGGEAEVTPGKHPRGEQSTTESVSSPKSAHTHHRGKKYQQAASLIDKTKNYPAADAVDLLYKTSTVKFDPTVEVHLNVNDKSIKGTINFPHDVGGKTKEKKYLILNEKQVTIDGKQIIWGNDQTIEDIQSGKLKPKRDFDQVLASPKYMPKLATVAKILGPLGIMPNPKNGTVTEDITSFFKKESTGGYQYKTDPTAPIIHTKIGKLSNKPQQLSDNLKALILAVGAGKIQKAVITSSMGPGIKVDIGSFSHT